MNSLQGASYAGLTFTCWDILITMGDEIELMWGQPKKFNIVKSLYFFSRYFALAIQITNTAIAGFLNARWPVASELCRLWLTYQVSTIYSLLGAVDVILMIRVYAFYNRQRWVAILMVFLLFFRIALSSASAALTVPNQEFNASCLSEAVPTMVMYFFLIGEFVLQSVILVLTFWRHFTAVRAGWARAPIVSLIWRDGATTFTVIVAVLIGTVVYARFGYIHESAHAVFPAFVAVMSCVGCRLIISMQKLVIPISRGENESTPSDSYSQDFTTIIESLWTGGASRGSSRATSAFTSSSGRLRPSPSADTMRGPRRPHDSSRSLSYLSVGT